MRLSRELLMKKEVFIVLLVFLLIIPFSQAANFNPPYPRIGQVNFYPIEKEVAADLWKHHDMIGYRSYGKRPASIASALRSVNPGMIILGASGISEVETKQTTKEYMPEAFFVHYLDGRRSPLYGDYLMNLADSAPEGDYIYGRQKFNEFFAEFSIKSTDLSVYDGLYFDTWQSGLKYYVENQDPSKIDLNFDGQPDSNVYSDWMQGQKVFVQKMRELHPGVIVIAHESGQTFLNGNAFEFWHQPHLGSRSQNFIRVRKLQAEGVEPHVLYANAISGDEETGAVFRGDFASAQIFGLYFGHDEEGAIHRYSFLHDEYHGDLGYPTSGIDTIKDSVYVRYFDKGVVLANIASSSKTIQASDLEGGPYYRFIGNQDPDFNNGELVDASHPIRLEPIDGIMLFKERVTLITDIVIDNMEINLNTVGQDPVSYSGSWKQAVDCSSSCKQVIKGKKYYGIRIPWDWRGSGFAMSNAGGGENKATYKPEINVPGEYEVFEWHGELEDKTPASNVPYKIVHAGGTKTGTLDQTRNVARWNSLGKYTFNKGKTGFVELNNNANGYVISDAIKFVFTGSSNYQPPASQPCSSLGGFPCEAGQSCEGGSFQYSSDHGSWCCVGGSECKDSDGGNGGGGDNTCSSGKGGSPCSSGQICEGGNFVSSSDHGNLCCVGGTCKDTSSSNCQEFSAFNRTFECVPMPLNMSMPVGTARSCIVAGIEPTSVESAFVKFTVFDVDSGQEASFRVNSGAWTPILATGDSIAIQFCHEVPVSDLISGSNTIEFRFDSDLGGTTRGYYVRTAAIAVKESDLLGDINQDGAVDIADLILLVRAFGTSQYDLRGDGKVDVKDLLVIVKKL